MSDVVIAGAVRTAIGAFSGGLSSVSAVDLGKIAITEALSRAGVGADEVSEVITGHPAKYTIIMANSFTNCPCNHII